MQQPQQNTAGSSTYMQQQQPNPMHMQQQQQQPILQQPVLDPLEMVDPNIMASMEVSNSLASDLDGMCLMHAYYKEISVYYFGWFFFSDNVCHHDLICKSLQPKIYYLTLLPFSFSRYIPYSSIWAEDIIMKMDIFFNFMIHIVIFWIHTCSNTIL